MGALAFSVVSLTCRVVSAAGAAAAGGGSVVDIAMGVGVAVPESSPVAAEEAWSALEALVAEAIDGAGSMCLVRLGNCGRARQLHGFWQ